MIAARLQRYALFLAGFDYDIEYKSTTKHCNAEGLSRRPLQQTEREETEIDSSEVFHATREPAKKLLGKHVEIQSWQEFTSLSSKDGLST